MPDSTIEAVRQEIQQLKDQNKTMSIILFAILSNTLALLAFSLNR